MTSETHSILADANVQIWAIGVIVAFLLALIFGLPTRWSRAIARRLAMLALVIVFIIPFVWLVTTTFKYSEETFIFPPRWIPSVPDRVTRSPYLVRSGESGEMSDDTWDAARGMVPASEINAVGSDAARRALAAQLAGTSREAVREAWAAVYRGVAIGNISVRDREGRTTSIPGDAVHWNIGPNPISYDFSNAGSIQIVGRIDRAAVPRDIASISIPIRQDRSWHMISFEVLANAKVYETRDALYLGANRWVEWTFKCADIDARDERSIGTWPIYPTTRLAYADDPHILIRIERLPHWRATLAKYTQSYRNAWYADPNWPRYLFNSVFLVIANVIGQMLACSMVAYAFARLRWPGRDVLFVVVLATMMLPSQVTMIPSFLIFKSIGWYNTLLPLWAPSFTGSAFFIFMMRQFMKAIPRELEEAALIDGCSWFGIYWRIILPLMRPALAAVAIFTFMNVWNDFLGPLIYLNDERSYPLSLGLYNFRSSHSNDFGMLMAASTMMMLPVIALFFMAERYFIQGVTLTGLKA